MTLISLPIFLIQLYDLSDPKFLRLSALCSYSFLTAVFHLLCNFCVSLVYFENEITGSLNQCENMGYLISAD